MNDITLALVQAARKRAQELGAAAGAAAHQ